LKSGLDRTAGASSSHQGLGRFIWQEVGVLAT
jgi:hypothetical protein